MLVDFTFCNLFSFRDETQFSMQAADDIVMHASSVLHVPDGNGELNLLPMAAIYGGNAAGKTNFTIALKLLKRCVLKQSVSGVLPFLLCDENFGNASMEVCFANRGRVYNYKLLVGMNHVTDEAPFECWVSLEELKDVTGDTEKCIFRREPDKSFKTEVLTDISDPERVRLMKMGPHKVLLAYLAEQFGDILSPCVEWFRDILKIVPAGSMSALFAANLIKNRDSVAKELNLADTSISDLDLQEVPGALQMLPTEALEDFKESQSTIMTAFGDDSTFFLKDEDGNVHGKQCYSYHVSQNGRRVQFPLGLESDGSRKYMRLLPFLLEKNPYVIVVDEIDRSLHPYLMALLTRRFRQSVVDGAMKQLIFTTHDVLLMKDNELRKDEIWLVNRGADGASQMHSYYDYKETEDGIDALEDYLSGHVGGLPTIEW